MKDIPCLGSWWLPLSCAVTSPKKKQSSSSRCSSVSFGLLVLLLLLVVTSIHATDTATAAGHNHDPANSNYFLRSERTATASGYHHNDNEQVERNHHHHAAGLPTAILAEQAAAEQITPNNNNHHVQNNNDYWGSSRDLQEDSSNTTFTLDDVDDEFCSAHCEAAAASIFADLPVVIQYLFMLLLIAFSALFSGLTLGLMGLDKTGLEIVMEGDDPVSAAAAKKIYPVRERGNLLLCTLLLGNVAVNALLSILLADNFGGLAGFLGSTGLIVIFGEIVPQALCSRYALQIGSRTVPLVRVIILIIYPVAAPLAYLLDKALGQELATTYSSAEMLKLLQIHVEEEKLDKETAVAMTGALRYKDMIVSQVMTPLIHTFMLSVDEKLNFETIATIFKTGYSRIPIYEVSKNNIIGLLFVKDLIFIDPDDETPVRQFVQIFGRGVHIVWPGDKLSDVLRELKQGRSHMALVRDVVSEGETDPYYEIKGIITLEDIIEEILGHEIVDETDAFVDGSHAVKVDRTEGFEMAKLRLLGSKVGQEKLTYVESKAITAHLLANYPQAVDMLTENQVERLVADTHVTVLPTATRELGKALPDDLMYEKGTPSDKCTLILSGKVTVIAGNDNIRTDVSSWTLLGISALRNADFKPDFTAFVCNGPCRCLQFTRETFSYALDASASERHAIQEDQFRKLALEKTHSRTGLEEGPASGHSQSALSEATSEYSESETPNERALRMDNRRSKLIAALQINDRSPEYSPSKQGSQQGSQQQQQHGRSSSVVGFGAGPHDQSNSSITASTMNEALGMGLYHPKADISETQDHTQSSSFRFMEGVKEGSVNSKDSKDTPASQNNGTDDNK